MKRIAIVGLAVIFVLTGCAGGDGINSNLAQDNSWQEPPPTSTPSASIAVMPPQSAPGAASGREGASSSESIVSSETAPITFRLTIPEGYTLARIGMKLEEMNICMADEFISAAQEGDFSAYPLIAQQLQDEHRCFKLEGYLYPDTYEFYISASAEDIIATMLGNMERKISEDLRAEILQSGYTVDQIIALASIIEKEAKGVEQMGMISSVLHNRLKAGMPLQCDVTITYVEGAIKPFITGDIDRYNSYYNTYKCPALPAGAICNPRIEAILAALRPEPSNYFYFLTDANDNFYYAETLEEHEANEAATGA